MAQSSWVQPLTGLQAHVSASPAGAFSPESSRSRVWGGKEDLSCSSSPDPCFSLPTPLFPAAPPPTTTTPVWVRRFTKAGLVPTRPASAQSLCGWKLGVSVTSEVTKETQVGLVGASHGQLTPGLIDSVLDSGRVSHSPATRTGCAVLFQIQTRYSDETTVAQWGTWHPRQGHHPSAQPGTQEKWL